jgi:hypothetical protein
LAPSPADNGARVAEGDINACEIEESPMLWEGRVLTCPIQARQNYADINYASKGFASGHNTMKTVIILLLFILAAVLIVKGATYFATHVANPQPTAIAP